MFSFRQKIFLSSAILFFVFIILLFPFISRWVHHIVDPVNGRSGNGNYCQYKGCTEQ